MFNIVNKTFIIHLDNFYVASSKILGFFHKNSRVYMITSLSNCIINTIIPPNEIIKYKISWICTTKITNYDSWPDCDDAINLMIMVKDKFYI